MNDLQISIIQEVKNFLDIKDIEDPMELQKILYDYRNSVHPDKIQNEELKEDAEEQFKISNDLFQKLWRYIQEAKKLKKKSDLILYKNDYELLDIKQNLIMKDDKIKNLKDKINDNMNEIADLKTQIDKLKKETLDEETDRLVALYKPSTGSLVTWGITFILSVLIVLLSKIDQIADILKSYPIFEQLLLNYLMWMTFAIITFWIIIKYFKKNIFINLSYKVKGINFIKKYSTSQYADYWDIKETKIFNGIQDQLVPKNRFAKFFTTKIFKIYDDNSLEVLKNIFIYNLINKGFLKIANTDKLDRIFKYVN
jgi:hypothetical protein